MRILFLFGALTCCSCAFSKPAKAPSPKSKPNLVEWKPTLPPLFSQKMPAGAKVPSLPRIFVPREAKNMAYLKRVTSDTLPLYGSFQQITDGQKDVWMTLEKGNHWVQIDLGVPCQIYAIHLWHGFAAPYVYRDVLIQISDDSNFQMDVVTIFNNLRDKRLRFGPHQPYIESRSGLLINTSDPNDPSKSGVTGITGRYVRFWSNGNNIDSLNRYMEIAVIGTTDYEPVKFELPLATYSAKPIKKGELNVVLPVGSYF